MNILNKYSGLTPRQRGILGYTTTVLFFSTLGYFYNPILMFLIWLLIVISIGSFLAPHTSNYFLTFSVGSSMMPTIPLGLTVNLVTDNFNDINVGDVVSFSYEKENNMYHHRIIDENTYGYKTKGDGNDVCDDKIITKDQIDSKTIQYGNQPLYIPISPLAIFTTLLKIYKKIQGKHRKIIHENIDIKNKS